MHTYELIKAILHGVDFYWKKLIAFTLFVVVIISGIFLWHSQAPVKADLVYSDESQFSAVSQVSLNIDINSKGKVLINGKDASKALKIFPQYYEVRILAIDNPGTFINSFRAQMNLPQPVTKAEMEQLIYAVHGISSYNSYMAGPQTLIFEATNIMPQATLTIAAHLPKNILTPSFSKQLIYSITNIPVKIYLVIAITLPAISLFIMFFMIVKRKKDQIMFLSTAPVNEPEKDISPAVAGVLIDGQVGSREIAATLISLANRGIIFITRKGDSFTFGKRKTQNFENLSELNTYEKILLSKIFESSGYKSTKDDVEMRVGRHIFSRKIAQVYLEIYNEATKVGYFIKNPAIVHRRWKYTGIALFLIGLVGFTHSALFAPDPKFELIFWLGEIAAGAVINQISGLMPTRSSAGSNVLKTWMGFRNYLKLKKPIEPGTNFQNKFIEYLPFAIVFGVEAEWAKRFMKEPFTKPDWYDSLEQVTAIEDFIGGLYPLISFTGGILAKSHEPTVE